MSEEVLIPASTETKLLRERAEYMRHVRLYGYSPATACLQIRSYGRTSGHGSVNRYAFSSALLREAEAVQLRDALNAWLAEQGTRASQEPAR